MKLTRITVTKKEKSHKGEKFKYYFQALMKPAISFVVSVARGALNSGILILLLPVIAPASAIWLAMPITETVVAIFVAAMMYRYRT